MEEKELGYHPYHKRALQSNNRPKKDGKLYQLRKAVIYEAKR